MKRVCAFTIVELLVSVAIVLLVGWLLLVPTHPGRKGSAQRIKCINNLKNLALASQIYSEDNSGRTAAAAFTNLAMVTAAEYLCVLSNEISTPKIVTCPTDNRVVESANFLTLSNRNVSYFVSVPRGVGDPMAFLFGDRNLQTTGWR